MSDEKENVLKLALDAEQMRALLALEKTTNQSVVSLIREGIEMYLRFRQDESRDAPEPAIFSPIVFDRPLRNDRDQ